jgi:hypothetical protein
VCRNFNNIGWGGQKEEEEKKKNNKQRLVDR